MICSGKENTWGKSVTFPNQMNLQQILQHNTNHIVDDLMKTLWWQASKYKQTFCVDG